MQRIRDDRGLADLDAGRLPARKSGAASRSRALTPKQRYGGEGSAWDEEREDGEHPFPLALIKTAWDLLIIYNFIAFRPGGFGMLGPELLTGAAMQRILSALVLLAITLPLTGCSLIGLAIGSASDSNAPEQITRFNRMDQLSAGTPLTHSTTPSASSRPDPV